MSVSSINRCRWIIRVVAASVVAAHGSAAWSQYAPPDTSSTYISRSGTTKPSPASAPASPGATFKQEELEQVLAPLALYPDALLSQVLMASTYPVEVVQAERWTKDNKALKGDALA